jgi:endo-1,4-beta-D-glucanase Y/Tol biopolymer transport system component
MMTLRSVAVGVCLALWCCPPLSAQPAAGGAQAGAGAFATGRYRNVFREAGHSDQEIAKKIEAAFQQLFHGDPETQAVFYWAGENGNGRLAYLSDINNRDVRSEGMSYGMMIAVQLGKKAEFDALWNWSRTFMYHDAPAHPAYGFFSWSMKTDGTPNSESPAPDGEEYWVTALYFASARWGDGKGIYDYRAMADRLLSDIKNRGVIAGPWASRPDRTETDGAQFNLEHKMVRFTPDNRRPDHTDPSYHLPAFYELWARWGPVADRPFWAEAARVSRDFLQKTTNPLTGLAPEYAHFDGTPVIDSRNQRAATFGPDAWRTAANWSVDWSWWAADPRERDLSDRIQAFFESKGLETYGNRWTLDGKTELETSHSPALVATNAVASLAATHARAARFVEALWNTDVPAGRYRYYDGLWYLMGLLHCSGQYRIWTPAQSTPAPVGIFDQHGDIGAVKTPGAATYDEATQSYTVRASGRNMWLGNDEFHFVWRRLSGDFILQARAEFQGAGVDPHRKMGLMVRSSLDPGAPHVNVSRHGDGLTSLQFRRSDGADTEEIRSDLNGPDVLQLERRGDTYTMSVASFGRTYATKELTGVALGKDVYVGIYVCAHNPDVTETAVLRNVRLIRPARDGFVPYREYIGSHVELLDVETGTRRIVHHVDDSIQAPNWTPDGKRLLMNRNGRMFSFDLAARTIGDIPTGAMTSNNNDHALSFDGKMLGLSGGQPSVVFTVPVEGGTPRQITPVGPSYLHGWSPDGRLLAFTGQRSGDFDVYVVPSAGGPETRLTTAAGLDDGPEFTPDGQWIYFNSTRTGRMQVWRMRPDGSRQEQLTFDDFNNWFPHVSPDGRSIVFITYGPEIRADDHPWYKQVYLRRIPRDGGTPTVVAYVYGGQGSMNVNSWSPDSRFIAFVSNSGGF